MRFRKSHVRTKVTALLVSLIALWGFAAWVTFREGLNVLSVSTLNSGVAQPSERLRVELQRERRLTVVMLSDRGSARQREALVTQRSRTEAMSAGFLREATSDSVRQAAGDTLNHRIDEAASDLRILAPLRRQVDTGQVDRGRAATAITGVIDSLFRVYDSMATLDDAGFAKDTRTFIEVSRAAELLAQEDALAAGALAGGGFTEAEHSTFAQTVGAQRFLLAKAAGELPPDDRAAFDDLARSEPYRRLRGLEDDLIASGQPEVVGTDTERWKSATGTVLTRVDRLVASGGDSLVERATPIAVGVVVRLALAGGLGLLAVIASIVLSITTARALVRRLEELRTAALDLAGQRLPGVVERLGRGDDVDVSAEAPPLAVGTDAIGQVGQAFNTVQETAIRVAVEQAELRRSYRGILLSLARRTQSLVHRQLTILDAMERRETEPAELSELFRVDHLATRMRRNAENLIVLSGASPGRAWRRSVPMVDVVRGALAEIEDYTQVTLMPMGEAELAGRAIGDVIHLLAELIENAVSFSPPYALVQVSGQEVGRGYVVEIEDRGLGMSPEDLAAANDRIADPPEFKLTGTPRLGLYVVSRLASRHHIQVTLKASPYGGTTVIVLLPPDLFGDEGEDAVRDTVSGAEVPDVLDLSALDRPAPDPEVRPSPDPAAPAATLSGDLPARRPERGRRGPGSPENGRRENGRQVNGGREGDPRFYEPPVAEPVHETPAPEPVFEPPVPEPVFQTPSGLPRRVAQAHLAPELRREPPVPPVLEPEDEEDGHSPEELRRLMESFQSGTERGRSEAGRTEPGPSWGDGPPTGPR
ncbi:sensor histidine kinase [Sphaerisporangium corydalis]|uniref:histidine kinase n=1 Tax=Sphaerisporangium corydalis TaxID=1441875 RepID=A0ABV9E9M9_9ACTN|nr:nitrate- and nitrite sensing domain-containing protein [Sphaerisporangium corydalis]